MGKTQLAPGFRFHPTDVELVRYYLKRKVLGKKLLVDAIAELDIYKFEPSDLPDKSFIKSGDLKWHFFCPREKKYSTGVRANRATACGFWKTTGKEREVLCNGEVAGKIKTLVYHFGKSPRGERTYWVMHEYRLEDKVLISLSHFLPSPMDSDAGPRQPQSGGKIVRPRRRFAVRTPYDRPAPRSRDTPQQNPSWISRLVYKPVTVIASGAGKFISSVVFSESSSSSSEDDEDSSSDIEGDEDVEKNITGFPEDETMLEESTIQRLGSKRVIEQLLKQGTFAREEGDRLIDIIKARVVDHPSVPTPNEGRHSDNEVDVGEMSNKAVMEAKRWLEEKKSASNSKSIATEDGGGSPVDVAKSYMRARLPWGSPAANTSEFRSPSPAGMQLLKEGTPFPYSAGNFSSSKLRRRSRSNPTWNIQDEIRKVRAKATEEMLKTVSPRSVASLNVDGGAQAVQIEQSMVLPNQTTESNQAVEETRVIHNTRSRGVVSTQGAGVDVSNDVGNDFIQPSSTIGEATNAVLAPGATLDPTGSFCIPKDVFETSKEADDDIGAARPIANGLPSSSPSSPVAMEAEASEPIVETPGDDITVGNGLDGAIDNKENNDIDSSASHNSSSTHEKEWLPGDQSLPNSNSASSSPGTSKVLAAPTRRGGRGRGRGRGRGVRGKGRGK